MSFSFLDHGAHVSLLLNRNTSSRETQLFIDKLKNVVFFRSRVAFWLFNSSSCHYMLAADPDYTCGGDVHTDFFFFPLSLSVCTLSSQICEWHVSLHLALTCIAYGHCIMARALVMQHPSTTRACEEVTRGRETNCLCKSIKKTKQLQPHLFTLWEDEGEKTELILIKK